MTRRLLKRFGQGRKGEGWYSFDHHGVHFIGLVNVASQGTDKGLGILGDDQLGWLKVTWPGPPTARPWSCSATSRSGNLPAVGVGHAGRPAGLGFLNGSARSRCSTATSTRFRRRWKGT